MLILSRMVNQSIIIQGNINVMVLRVERDRVKLGIEAPKEVTVLREELLHGDRRTATTGDQTPPKEVGQFIQEQDANCLLEGQYT